MKIFIPLNCRACWYRSNKASPSSIGSLFEELFKFLTFFDIFSKKWVFGLSRVALTRFKFFICLNCRAYWCRSTKLSLSSIRQFFEELSKFLSLFDGRTNGQTLLYSCWPQLKNLHFWAFWAKKANFGSFWPKWAKREFFSKKYLEHFSAFLSSNKLKIYRKK